MSGEKRERNIIIKNASEIITPKGFSARHGKQMSDLSITKQASIFIEDGLIKAIGENNSILKNVEEKEYTIIDATGMSILPGFVDSHTHFLFYGSRADEFTERVKGVEYMEIMRKGGGISQTVRQTRSASESDLFCQGLRYLNEMVKMGITAVEGKSGYGLDFDTEIRMLRIMNRLREISPLDIVITFLGAHAVPEEYKKEEYIDFIIEKLLPYISEKNLAEFCDIFCEKEVFTVLHSRKLLQKAKSLGFKLKIHADEMADSGGSELAVELEAITADHLLNISDEGIKKLSNSRTVATLLPLTAFCLKKNLPPARKLIDGGCAVALATDFNPGSCFSFSIPLMIAISVLYMNMSLEETITALTINGAAAIDRANEIGSIEVGKKADLILLKYPSYQYLSYHTGINIVDKVIKDGKIVS